MESFDTIWETIHSKEEWGKYPSEPVIRFIARNYYKLDRSSVKILDFGCGAGSNTWYLAREGFDTYAFDGSRSAIGKVKDRFAREGLKADLKVCDALELEYQNEFFDCIIDNATIYANKFNNIKMMYQEVYDKLKVAGKIFTVMFSKNTTGYGTGKEIELGTFLNVSCGNLQGRGIVHFFDREEIASLLFEVGFNGIETDLLRYTDRGNVVEQYLVSACKVK